MRNAFAGRVVVVLLAATLTACAGGGAPVVAPGPRVGHAVYKIGNPYQVAGVWYYPKEQPGYDQTGIASWYGSEFHGQVTADGEVFDRNAVSAAHPTLPLPSNVRVTDLENGRSLVVRVNDRGPFVNGRIIDLSERAAELLGYHNSGTARVRVTYLGPADLNGSSTLTVAQATPPEIANAVAAAPTVKVVTASLAPVGGVAVAAPTPIAPLPQPAAEGAAAPPAGETVGQVTEVPVPPVTAIYVQAGAFASLTNAARVMTNLQTVGAQLSQIMKDGRPLYRVRIGPFQDVNRADAALAKVEALGHHDVEIIIDSPTGA